MFPNPYQNNPACHNCQALNHFNPNKRNIVCGNCFEIIDSNQQQQIEQTQLLIRSQLNRLSAQSSPQDSSQFYQSQHYSSENDIPISKLEEDSENSDDEDEISEEVSSEENSEDEDEEEEVEDSEEESESEESSSFGEKEKEKENWITIHPDFAKEKEVNFFSAWTYQRIWIARGCTAAEAQELIKAGFEPQDYETAASWKGLADSAEVAAWFAWGLTKEETDLASYLKVKQLQLDSKLKLKKLRKEFSKWKENPPAQEYLAVYYPAERISLIDKNRRSAYLWKNDNQGKTRSQTIYLDLGGKKPNGNFRSDWFY